MTSPEGESVVPTELFTTDDYSKARNAIEAFISAPEEPVRDDEHLREIVRSLGPSIYTVVLRNSRFLTSYQADDGIPARSDFVINDAGAPTNFLVKTTLFENDDALFTFNKTQITDRFMHRVYEMNLSTTEKGLNVPHYKSKRFSQKNEPTRFDPHNFPTREVLNGFAGVIREALSDLHSRSVKPTELKDLPKLI